MCDNQCILHGTPLPREHDDGVAVMWIEQRNLRAKLLRSTPAEKDWLVEYLTFESAEAKRKSRGTAPVQRERLFDLLSSTFPSGFVPLVLAAAAAEGFQVQVADARTPPCALDDTADLAWLRDYQLGAVEALARHTRGILWLPTGAGKTEIIVGLTRRMPCRWLAVVHRSQLADDIASRYEKRSPGLVAGRILEGTWSVPEDATLIAATFQSVAAALKKGEKRVKHLLQDWAQGVIVDECHTLPAASFFKIAMQTRSAYYRVGLSGTPLARGDQRSLYAIGALGKIVYRIRSELLINRGILAKPTIRMATLRQTCARPTWAGVYSALIVKSKARNALLVALTKRATYPAFLFVQQVEHGRDMERLLLQNGIRAQFVWGSHSIEYRKSLIRRLVQGHFDVIVCSSVFNEGIDVPELRSVILGAGGKSVIATLQRLGRGMRVEKDKAGNVVPGGDRFEVYDVLDKGNTWTEKHAKARLAAYTAERFETYVEPENGQLPLIAGP